MSNMVHKPLARHDVRINEVLIRQLDPYLRVIIIYVRILFSSIYIYDIK
jgi:hypothetical protein